MEKHTCKNSSCNRIFEYCRGCLLSPIPHMDAGFCSKECYEASKKVVEPIVEIESIVEEIATVEIEEIQPVEIEAKVNAEAPIVAEPTIKKETYNAYRKKNKKHR